MFQRIIIPGLIVTVASFVAIMFIHEEYVNVTRLLIQEESLDTDLANAATVEQRRTTLEAQYASFPQDADERLAGLLPESIHPARIILDIQEVAKRNGLRLGEPNVSEEERKILGVAGGLQATVISFDTSATYDQLKLFLRDIERSLTLRTPTSIEITVDQNAMKIPDLAINPVLKVRMSFESYAFPGGTESENAL